MRGVGRFVTLICLGALLWGCAKASSSTLSKPDGGDGAAGGTAGSGGTATSSSHDAGIPDNEDLNVNSGDANAPLADGQACVNEVREAERVEVDLFIMLDRSGSMSNETPMGTKWSDITSALSDFVADPGTANIGIGLQYFPILNANVPTECTTDDECNGHGPCLRGTCEQDPFNTICQVGTNCAGQNNPCIPLGTCERDSQTFCAPANSGLPCPHNLGACVEGSGICENEDSCQVADYSTPEIPITTGAARTQQFTDSLMQNTPGGNTPTAPALQGAIEYAKSWALAHPERAVAVVLATDGLPTECGATDITQITNIASTGAGGSPPIRTFVVGVFGAADVDAPGNLDAIAIAGHTQSALIVDANGDVSGQFLDALNTIRSTALSCDFKLPSEGTIDYDLVNLRFDDGSGKKSQLVNVQDPNGCADNDHTGWYYVLDDTTQMPTQISVCPGVCDDFKNTTTGRVDLQIGCKTIVR